MSEEELFSAKQIQELEDAAFLEGALACSAAISNLIDKAKKQDNHSIAAALEKRIDNLGLALVGTYVETLEEKLKLRALISEAELEQPEEKAKVESQ